MDANGQHFWLALGGGAWQPDVPGTLALGERHLCLASRTVARAYPESVSEAEAALAKTPMSADAFGGFALYDAAAKTIRGGGTVQREDETGQPRAEKISELPAILAGVENVTDVALGFDGLLYLATGGKLRIHDVRGRLAPAEISAADFDVWRLAAVPGGGVWVLDRERKKLARLIGAPWPPPLDFASPPAEAFLPVEENSNPPRFVLRTDEWLAAGEDPVALACRADGRLAVLLWTGAEPKVRLLSEAGRANEIAVLKRVQKPFSLAWISTQRFAVLAAGVSEALVYEFLDGAIEPAGEIFPLRDHDDGPFLHSVSLPVQYACRLASDTPGDPLVWTRPLVSISLPAFAKSARGNLTKPFDSGVAGIAWHRLYVEAEIPSDTSFTLFAAATDGEIAPAKSEDWHAHHFGVVSDVNAMEPRAAWVSSASELPGHTGFMGEPPVRERSGLFTVLLQRSNRRVRTLRGRFLHLRIELRGNLRSSPALYAVRAYAPRFAYQEKYLPSLYRETLFGTEADAVQSGGTSTRADFLGRFLANFEGVLTPMEDAVAASWLLTDARSTPLEAIDWLGSWIGVAFEPWYPVERRRAQVRHAAELFRTRGTLRGLKLALDIATGGAIQQGRVIVVEDFWFRRTLQTVLGLELDREDPLLGGVIISGNSKVGETLFLGEESAARKFLALFDASIQLKQADQRTVEEFFTSLAQRVTVIVHEEVAPAERKLIERVVALEVPAHVAARVKIADRDFITGLAALLGVDTYLYPEPPPEPVEIQKSRLGAGPQLLRPPSLDPRLEGRTS